MKKIIIAIACCALVFNVAEAKKKKNEVKKEEGFVFTTVKENPITSIKNQHRSSTCWSFSGLAFFESELIRMGKGTYDLAEMFLVSKTMQDRAKYCVRLHGDAGFTPGGSFYDAVFCLRNYGMVPQSAMPTPGTLYSNDTLPNHSELDAVAGGYVNAIAKGRFKKLSPAWIKGLTAIYDTYLGECPEKFVYNGKEYTPKSFANELGLNMDDYVSLTSYTHQPLYSTFSLEIQDNWRQGLSYNLTIDELMEVIDNAVRNGYTVAWGADVSEDGFTRNGVAIVPDMEKAAELGSDMAHWLGLSASARKDELNANIPEKEITQEMRQEGYENWTTTDDHGMLIYGIAKDQNGKEYYMVKNSWGKSGKYEGIWYASKAFVKYKTMNILVHKDAIPEAIKNNAKIK